MWSLPPTEAVIKKRFTVEWIIGIFKEVESGAKVADVFRKHGISDATCYN